MIAFAPTELLLAGGTHTTERKGNAGRHICSCVSTGWTCLVSLFFLCLKRQQTHLLVHYLSWGPGQSERAHTFCTTNTTRQQYYHIHMPLKGSMFVRSGPGPMSWMSRQVYWPSLIHRRFHSGARGNRTQRSPTLNQRAILEESRVWCLRKWKASYATHKTWGWSVGVAGRPCIMDGRRECTQLCSLSPGLLILQSDGKLGMYCIRTHRIGKHVGRTRVSFCGEWLGWARAGRGGQREREVIRHCTTEMEKVPLSRLGMRQAVFTVPRI